jgi:uncharacterized protein (TIGR02302 family)
MPSRRAHFPRRTEFFGSPQLTFAYLLVGIENGIDAFALPLLLIGIFVALAFLGVFKALYPWAHLAALVVFTVAFFDALGKSRRRFHPASRTLAKRRVEAASGLKHRPLDVLEDRPASADPAQQLLWQTHAAQARAQTARLRWPRWVLSLADRDPYALRYALLILLTLGALSGWGVWGGRLLAAINPDLGREFHLLTPTLDAWITPPEYTGLPPIMIATPAGARHDSDVIDVPTGSVITAHLADHGDTPTLVIGGKDVAFSADDHSDFGVTQAITAGDRIAISRGWQTLASWRIRVIPDNPPAIAFSEPPSATARATTQIAYEASDDYGVASVRATITPRESLAGAPNTPVEVELSAPQAKDVKRVAFEDLTASPWAGMSVAIRLKATDAAGHVTETAPQDFVLPERAFFHPIARVLVDERKKLLMNPDDDNARNEAANIMAGIAHEPSAYKGDPVVLMALRTGAVRLVLDRSREAIPPVSDALWQTAVRIEDGTAGVASETLRQAQKDLADALDSNASDAEVQKLIDRLHQALARYLSELSAQAAMQPVPPKELQQLLGPATNMLTPEDLDRMLEQMRGLSAAGSRDEARAELQQLQQLLENLGTSQPHVTAEQQAKLERLAALRELSGKQQKLLDETFRSDGADHSALALQQENLRQALRSLIESNKGDDVDDLNQTDRAMKEAGARLQHGTSHGALAAQNEAMADLDRAIKNLSDDLRSAMLMLPRPGFGAGGDPFGRSSFGGFANDDGSVRVPDQMDVRRVREIMDELERRAGDGSRTKDERDYIERLLQNF